MNNYFTRLAQRSGISGAGPMPPVSAVSTSAPLEQNVEIAALPAQHSENATARETAVPKQIETPPASQPLQEVKRAAETPKILPTEAKMGTESRQSGRQNILARIDQPPIGAQSERRAAKVQPASEHMTVARKISATPSQPSKRAPLSVPAVEVSPPAAVPKSASSRLLPEHTSVTTKNIEPESSTGFRETAAVRGRADVAMAATGVSQRPATASTADPFSGPDTRSSPPGNTLRGEPISAASGGPVEIRIGTIALEVRAPQTQAPAPRPRAKPAQSDSFSPYRHYLRSW
jgi:hypothetical protein